MKKYFVILLLLLSIYGFSQYQLVHYKFSKHIPPYGETLRDDFLLFNAQELFYIHHGFLKKYKDYQSFLDSEEKSLKNKSNMTSLYRKLVLSRYYGIKWLDKRFNYYFDDVPTINWKIQSDRKQILGYTCTKAIGKFRGRTYVVWFAPFLPYYIGPWKLSGLPGLILEAHDTDNMFAFRAVSVKLNAQLPVLEKYINAYKGSQKDWISYKEYVACENRRYRLRQKKHLSQVPKGVQVSKISGPRDFKLEKSFEWEPHDKSKEDTAVQKFPLQNVKVKRSLE